MDKRQGIIYIDTMKPRETIAAFDAHLAERGLRLNAVVIGGAALGLLGITSRTTRDCDVMHPTLPPEILLAAREFAALRRLDGKTLSDEWLNNGPASLVDALPPGWEARLQLAYTGQAITLNSLGRLDLLRSKLFALCDRGIDKGDCLALAPNRSELDAIAPWLALQDANPGWPAHTQSVLADLGEELVKERGHGL